MMSPEPADAGIVLPATDETELLECLRKIGKGLIASGTAVGVVENTLTEIALAYNVNSEIMALPNYLTIKLGQSPQVRVDFAVQQLTTLQFDQISEFVELIDRVKQRKIPLVDAILQMDRISAKPHRFNSLIGILGYALSCIGLTSAFPARTSIRSVMESSASRTDRSPKVAMNVAGDRGIDAEAAPVKLGVPEPEGS